MRARSRNAILTEKFHFRKVVPLAGMLPVVWACRACVFVLCVCVRACVRACVHVFIWVLVGLLHARICVYVST